MTLKQAIENMPVEMSDLEIVAAVVLILKDCERNRVKNGYGGV